MRSYGLLRPMVVTLGIGLMTSSGHAVEIVCHRGGNEYAPENTRAAARVCLDWGVDYIEVDVRASKDGVFYIMHDGNVARTTDGRGELGALTSKEIDTLDAGSWFDPKFAGERVPRLKRYLRWLKGKAKVFFDVKRVDVAALVKLIRDTGFEKDCFLWSSDDAVMATLAKTAPDLALKVNATTPEAVRAAHRDLGARIVEFGPGDITPELLAACRELGIKTMVMYGEKDPEVFRKVIDSGVDMINLDHADAFIRVRDGAPTP